MKLLILLLLAVGASLAAIWLLPLLVDGRVVLQAGTWYVETRLLVAVVLGAALLVALWLAIWLWRLPGNAVRKWLDRSASRQFEAGILALTEGRYEKAEKALTKAAKRGRDPAVGYLAAARAAQGRGEPEARNAYLDKADSAARRSDPVKLTRAELLMAEGKYQEALSHLQQLGGGQPRALRLTARCHRELENWHALVELAPRLKKAGLLEADEAAAVEQRAARKELAETVDAGELERSWKGLSRSLKSRPQVLVAYAESARQLGSDEQAESALRAALKKAWSEPVALAYSQLDAVNPKGLALVRAHLQASPDDPVAHLAAGRLLGRSGDLDAAVEHLQTSLALRPDPIAFGEVAHLLARRGDGRQALTAYAEALGRPLPKPASPELGAPESTPALTADSQGKEHDSGSNLA